MFSIDLCDMDGSLGRIEVREGAFATRLERQCQGSWYVLSWVLRDDIHQWLLDYGQSDYRFALNEDTRIYQVFLDSSVAMLFKLTWV